MPGIDNETLNNPN